MSGAIPLLPYMPLWRGRGNFMLLYFDFCNFWILQRLQYPFIVLYINYYYCYYFCGSAAQRGLWPPHLRGFLITHDAPHSVGLFWTSDQLVTETST
jgi:hypothetical protein